MLKALKRELLGLGDKGSEASSRTFVSAIAAGDRFRDAREWASAEAAYATALAVRPEEGGYWVQHAHMLKEQDRFETAEVSYRTALACGAPAQHVLEHLRFVMARQGLSEQDFPIRVAAASTVAERPPTRPDILKLARLLWGDHLPDNHEIARLMRLDSGSLDGVFAAMVADPRFQRAHLAWLHVARVEDV